MRSVISLRFALIIVALAGFTTVNASLAESLDSGKPTRFAGSPVTIAAPEPNDRPVYVDLRLSLDEGVCKVSRQTREGGSSDLVTMGKGTYRTKLSPGETLQLDPQGHGGEYSVRFEPVNARAELMAIFASALGMILVAVVAVVYWRRTSHAGFRWFWIGTGLWTVAVAAKVGVALVINRAVIGLLKASLSHPFLLLFSGLFAGVESSVCEIGLTLLAALIWRQLGKDAGRAIAIGVGAGAFEAFLLGVVALVPAVMVIAGLPGAERMSDQLGMTAASTPLFWLIGPAERVMAILCHASSRALVLLGVAHRKYAMIAGGFAIFTAIDAIAGAAHISEKLGRFSPWWIELAILPLALISVPTLKWCYHRWGSEAGDVSVEQAQHPGQ